MTYISVNGAYQSNQHDCKLKYVTILICDVRVLQYVMSEFCSQNVCYLNFRCAPKHVTILICDVRVLQSKRSYGINSSDRSYVAYKEHFVSAELPFTVCYVSVCVCKYGVPLVQP